MEKPYLILAIDTSCDETSVAVTVDDRVIVNVISSQVELHKKWGGVVPILAKRAHEERIDSVVNAALGRFRIQKSKIKMQNEIDTVDAIAVTIGPGLAPSLEVGIRKAKELATDFNKPIIAVNHMEGHLVSSFAKNAKGKGSKITGLLSNTRQGRATTDNFPLLGLLISGGHTQLVLVNTIGDYKLIGETLDDAVGEAFDKVAKMLELGYPGGPIIERLAKEGDEYAFDFPIPMRKRQDENYNFSYSGIKTALLYKTRELKEHGKLDRQTIQNLASSFQRVVAISLTDKLEQAAWKLKPKGILIGGGVAANLYIRNHIRSSMRKLGIPVFIPFSRKLFTDNAAMIGVCAYYSIRSGRPFTPIGQLDRDPNRSF